MWVLYNRYGRDLGAGFKDLGYNSKGWHLPVLFRLEHDSSLCVGEIVRLVPRLNDDARPFYIHPSEMSDEYHLFEIVDFYFIAPGYDGCFFGVTFRNVAVQFVPDRFEQLAEVI